MSLGERLTKLRKEKGLSQEEVAEKLNVTRQTVSKWETDQSTPDFDKVIPICELYGITSEELLTGNKKEEQPKETPKIVVEDNNKEKRTLGLVIGILAYFIALAWIIIADTYLNQILAVSLFLLIIGIGTCIIIYSRIVYKNPNKSEEDKKHKLPKPLDSILSISFLIIYLGVSFLTMAWHITWLIWIVYGLVEEIIILILSLRGDKNE